MMLGKVGAAATLSGLFLTFWGADMQRESLDLSKQWRQEDTQKESRAAEIQSSQHNQVASELKSIREGVNRDLTAIEAQPLVLATVVRDQTFKFKQSRQRSANSPFVLADSTIELIAASERSLIDVSAVWIVGGHIQLVAVQNAVLTPGERLPLNQIPGFAETTINRGTLRVQFSDSGGFRGKVDHPFVISKCPDHVHVTVEPHTYQAWLPPSNTVFTN